MLSDTRAGFQTTSWSLVLAAGSHPAADSRQALSRLCQTYWHPVYAFIRRRGYDRAQSEDLTQGFFAQLLEKNYLVAADQERGRFRSFLLTMVKNFLANEWDRSHALKRGGGQVAVSIDVMAAENWYLPAVVEETTPELLFERRWAVSVLEQGLAKLRAEFNALGKADQFDALFVFLNGEPEESRYDKVAESLRMSAGALRLAVYRMRKRYRKILREEIAETVSTPEQVEDEIRFLMATFSR